MCKILASCRPEITGTLNAPMSHKDYHIWSLKTQSILPNYRDSPAQTCLCGGMAIQANNDVHMEVFKYLSSHMARFGWRDPCAHSESPT